MNIIDAIEDRELFAPFLGRDHSTWGNWMSALRCLYGLPLRRQDRLIIRECTGRRKLRCLPGEGFSEALFITGRRSGKSRTAALIGGFEAVFGGHEKKLAPGEQGMVAILAPTREQAGIVFKYLRALFETPMLAAEVVRETRTKFELRNGLTVAVLTGDHKRARGYTLVCAIVDELAFFGVDDAARVKNDTELVRGLKPSLATTGGKLIGITSPWIKAGYVYRMYKRNHANDTGRVLVWNCGSRTMNPTLPQSVIDEALEEDPTAARSEYLGEFREGASQFITPDIVEALVKKGRVESIPDRHHKYVAFFDASGGRADSASMAIAHTEEGRVVLDLLQEWRAPHNPPEVIRKAAGILGVWGIRSVTGDRYAAGFVERAFHALGRHYRPSDRSKSEIYMEALPLLCSGAIELLDNDRMVKQFSGLIRLSRSGGKDIVDHPPGGHDDLCNAACGALVNATAPEGGRIGVWGDVGSGNRARNFVHVLMNCD